MGQLYDHSRLLGYQVTQGFKGAQLMHCLVKSPVNWSQIVDLTDMGQFQWRPVRSGIMPQPFIRDYEIICLPQVQGWRQSGTKTLGRERGGKMERVLGQN